MAILFRKWIVPCVIGRRVRHCQMCTFIPGIDSQGRENRQQKTNRTSEASKVAATVSLKCALFALC
jgi:hypothetical protein